MQAAKIFEDLIIWQKAHAFVHVVCRFTQEFPKSEKLYGLTFPLRHATVSIAANIAEGFRQTGSSGKVRFMNIAQACTKSILSPVS